MFYIYINGRRHWNLRFASLQNAKDSAVALSRPGRRVYAVICL